MIIDDLSNIEPRLLSPGLLAYIGDSIYEITVRTWLLKQGYRSLHEIHEETVKYVNATAQAKGLKAIRFKLSSEEEDIVRKGRNSKTGNIPVNAEMIDYRYSTGLEALFGYLYLRGDYERINELWEMLIRELEGE